MTCLTECRICHELLEPVEFCERCNRCADCCRCWCGCDEEEEEEYNAPGLTLLERLARVARAIGGS